MYVPQDGVVYSNEVMELCTETREQETTTEDSEGVMYDPLLNPPKPSSDLNQPWSTAVLILIPLRLGELNFSIRDRFQSHQFRTR